MTSSVTFGSRETQHLSVTVLRREHPGTVDYWDGNWVVSRIEAHLGGFAADYQASLRTEELRRLRQGLELIDANLSGSAVLASLEGWIELEAACLPNGALKVTGELCDQAGPGNRLAFELDGLDQTHLPDLLDAPLGAVERSFPVLGRP